MFQNVQTKYITGKTEGDKELADFEKSAESLTDLIADLDLRLSTEFKNGVEKINVQFKVRHPFSHP